MTRRLWDPCVSHCGEDTDAFVKEYFSDECRRVALFAGAGFDPRSTRVTQALTGALGSRIRGIFLREQRSGSSSVLADSAEANTRRLVELVPNSRVAAFPVFSTDNATVGGRRVIEVVRREEWDDVTDVVVDLSALSVGVGFPLVRFLFDRVRKDNANLHVFVTDHPETDCEIIGVSSDKAETLHGFKGNLGLHETAEVTVLWLPQLTPHRGTALRRVHTTLAELTEHREVDVCPILPFPSRNPRRGDELIEHYREEFESIWRVDARDLVYVDERRPVDLYRTVLDIDDARRRVFRRLGGSMTVLSPFGSKVQSLGTLMAALERDFPVVYVETLAYTSGSAGQSAGDLVHVWLHGAAYGRRDDGIYGNGSG